MGIYSGPAFPEVPNLPRVCGVGFRIWGPLALDTKVQTILNPKPYSLNSAA